MKKYWLFLAVVLWGWASVLAQNSPQKESLTSYQEDISNKVTNYNLRLGGERTFKSISELHKWYLTQEMSLNQQYPKKCLKLKGVYSYWDYGKKLFSGHLYTALEYQNPTNTLNAVVSLYSTRFSDNFTGSIKGILGKGITDVSNINDKIANNLGWAFELDYSSKQLFNPFIGVSQTWIDPENVENGGSVYMYAGNRFFIYKRMISLDFKGGMAYWRGFEEQALGDYFLSGALAYHKDVTFSWAGAPLFSRLESSLFYSRAYRTLNGKFTLPIRIFNELSLGLSAMLGSDTRTMKNDQLPGTYANRAEGYKKEFSSFYGLGIDIRLFGDVLYPFPAINPYISIMRNFVEYERGLSDGTGYSVYFGSRFKITGPLSLDVFTGPAFWSDPWVRSYATDERFDKPSVWNLGLGLTYQIGKVKPKIKKLVGQIYISDDKDMSEGITYPTEREINPLASEVVARELIETMVYSLEEKQPDPLYGDVSDIKFFTYSFSLFDSLDETGKRGLITSIPDSAGNIYYIALFDKKKSRVQYIKPENMLLHFVDLENSRYFGYRWDRNRTLQPEFRDFAQLNIFDKTKPSYYGSFHSFVDTLNWVDETEEIDGMTGNYFKKRIFNKLASANAGYDSTNFTSDPTPGESKTFSPDNYRLAFISMKRENIEKIKSVCPNFGVCIMFNKDVNENRKVFVTKNDSIVTFDSDDAFFFSNTERFKELSSGKGTKGAIGETEQSKLIGNIIKIKNFSLGKANLDEKLKNYIKTELDKLKANNVLYNEIHIYGYTDATPLVEGSKYKTNYQLSLARAQKVKDALLELGIPAKKITTVQGLGIKVKGNVKTPEDRSVKINFVL